MLVSVWGLLTALVLAHMPVGQPALRQAGGAGGALRAARRAGDGAAVRAVPAHRAAVGRAAGRRRRDRAVELDADGRVRRAGDRRQHRAARALRRRACRRPRRCTSAARCCRASTAASGRASSALRDRRRACARRAALRGAAAALRDDARAAAAWRAAAAGATPTAPTPRRSRGHCGASWPTCSGAPIGRSPSACASRPQAWPLLRHGPRDPMLALHELSSCRPAPTRARWPGPPRCAASRATAQADAAHAGRRGDAAHPQRRLHLHAEPGAYGERRDRRVLARPQAGLLRALRRRLRRRACGRWACRRASSPATRAPTRRRWTATHRAPEQCPRLGRVLAAGRGWVRADPTAAVAPERIVRSRSLRPRPAWSPARSAA